MTPQEAMKSTLEKSGIPHKEIRCYGNQIVITSHSRDAAERWAGLLVRFAKLRCVIETMDDAKVNKGSNLLPTKVKVWRTFAAIQ